MIKSIRTSQFNWASLILPSLPSKTVLQCYNSQRKYLLCNYLKQLEFSDQATFSLCAFTWQLVVEFIVNFNHLFFPNLPFAVAKISPRRGFSVLSSILPIPAAPPQLPCVMLYLNFSLKCIISTPPQLQPLGKSIFFLVAQKQWNIYPLLRRLPHRGSLEIVLQKTSSKTVCCGFHVPCWQKKYLLSWW